MELDRRDQDELDARSWVAFAVFFVVIVFVIRPVRFKVFRIPVSLDLATVPLLGVIILLASQTMTGTTLRDGFLGSNLGVQPYAIMLLFYSLAYICISLDMTGLFQFSAFWVSRRAGNRGILAFTLFFILTSLISGLASNDVVILTGTAFLSYFTRVSDIEPTAFLMSEFTTANIASMALYIGNPTNVVVSEAFNLTFIEYSAWMLIPTFVCLGIAYILLRLIFRNQRYLPRVIHPPDAKPASVLIDKTGAIFGLGLLGVCLITLIGTSFVHGVSVWMVTVPFAVIMLLHDLWHDLPIKSAIQTRRKRPQPPLEIVKRDDALSQTLSIPSVQKPRNSSSDEEEEVAERANEAIDMSILGAVDYMPLPERNGPTPPVPSGGSGSSTVTTNVVESSSSLSPAVPPATTNTEDAQLRKRAISAFTGPQQREQEQSDVSTQQQPSRSIRRIKAIGWIQKQFPTSTAVIARMPWKILPFAICMFMLVECLSEVGFIGIFATALSAVTPNYAATVFSVMAISLVVCQFLNNLPMTILLTRVLQHPNFAHSQTGDVITQAAVLGLIIGSNLGACLTLVGSLAGIMFDHILKTKGIYTLGYFQFLKWNLSLLPIIATGAAAVAIGELWFIYLR